MVKQRGDKINQVVCYFSPSVSMFWSGISKLISIMLDSFQEPLNMLEKYPDCKMHASEEKQKERKSIK